MYQDPDRVADPARSDLPILTEARALFRFGGRPGDPRHGRILETIRRMLGVGPNADAIYHVSVRALRPDGPDVAAMIGQAYHSLIVERRRERWALVQLLSDLLEPAALAVLDTIVGSRVSPPRDRDPDDHHHGAVTDELVIRTTAVEAAVRLARHGSREARDLLLKHVSHPSFSVRRACVQGYLATGDATAAHVLRQVLPANEHYLLEIRPLPMSKVPVPRVDGDDAERLERRSPMPPPGTAPTAPPDAPSAHQPGVLPAP